MKTLVTKKMSKILSLVIVAVLTMGMPSTEVKAAENDAILGSKVEKLDITTLNEMQNNSEIGKGTRALLYNCMISVNCSSNGMRMSFVTDCVQEASTIGVKDIKIEQKVWYGWKTVATSSGGKNYNSTSYMGQILYTNVVMGETYRISCVHYADADEYTELDNEVDVIFTY